MTVFTLFILLVVFFFGVLTAYFGTQASVLQFYFLSTLDGFENRFEGSEHRDGEQNARGPKNASVDLSDRRNVETYRKQNDEYYPCCPIHSVAFLCIIFFSGGTHTGSRKLRLS